MEIFGFSAAKIIAILVIAVVIFGPDKVPEMVGTVGRTIRDVRRYLNEMTKEFDAATGDLRAEFTAITRDLQGELAATQADLRNQLDLTSIFAEVGAAVAVSPPSPSTSAATESVARTYADDGGIPHALPSNDGSLATASAGNLRGPMRHVTKSDPLADLAVATAPAFRAGALPALHGCGVTETMRAIATSDAAQSDGAPRAMRLVVGRSVAASAYVRRTGRITGSCRGVCRSAHTRPGTIARGGATFVAATPAPIGTP